jgi:drug/metabolite transporter (DMT)-like permease
MAARFTLATLVMAAIHWKSFQRLPAAEVWAGVKIGVFLFGGYAFQTLGLVLTTPSKSGFITGSSVVLVPVLMALFWGRRVNHWIWIGAIAAAAGLYFITVPKAGTALHSGRHAASSVDLTGGLNRGDLLTLVAAALFAVHIILVGRYTKSHSVGALSFLQVAVTALLNLAMLPILAATEWEKFHLDSSRELLLAILITAVFATAVAFSVQVWAQNYTSPSHTAILFSLEPVFAALTSFIVLHERLGARALFGACLVMLGILFAELRGPSQAAADSPGPVTASA